MTLIFLLILLLVWFFMIAPFIRLYRTSKQWRNAFEQAQKQQQQRRRNNAPRPPAPPKKKIDPTVGEYVEFTETVVAESEWKSTQTTSDAVHTERESQVSDISWEEIE